MRKTVPLMVLAAASAFMLAACSSEPEPTSSPTDDATTAAPPPAELTDITVGVIPIVDVAPIYLGVQQGFFEDAGLNVTLEIAQGGAAIVPAVVSGDYQFGFSNLTSLLLASNNDVPIKAVAAGNYTTGDTSSDFGAVVVPADSDIKTAADLAGHTVAVNTLNNIGDSTIRNVVEKDGGDQSTIQFVEMGFPDMPAAVNEGQVDAAWILEPHLTRAIQGGARVVTYNYAETDPDLMIAAYFTSDAFLASDPDTVDKFVTAMKQSLEYAEAHPDETRAVLDEYTEIDAGIKDAMVMPRYLPDMSEHSFQLLADLAVKYGAAPSLDVSKILP